MHLSNSEKLDLATQKAIPHFLETEFTSVEKISEVASFLPGVLMIHQYDEKFEGANNLFTSEQVTEIIGINPDEIKELQMEYSKTITRKGLLPIYLKRRKELLQSGIDQTVSYLEEYLRFGEEAIISNMAIKPFNENSNQLIILATPIKDIPYVSERFKSAFDSRSFLQKFPVFNSLTKREKEVISMVCAGLTNQQIADQIFVSRETVKSHRRNIKSKVGYKSAFDLYKFAIEFGLADC